MDAPPQYLRKVIHMEKRRVIIPKDTKIYGLVYHSNSRYPFNIGGKAKLFITVSRIKLEDGTEFKIRFTEPPDNVVVSDKVKGLTRNCRKSETRKCIVGRRAKLSLPTTALSSGTATGLLLVKDDNATAAIAGLTFLDTLSKAAGVDNLVNPPNAELKGSMVFDVILENYDYTGVWIPLPKPKKE